MSEQHEEKNETRKVFHLIKRFELQVVVYELYHISTTNSAFKQITTGITSRQTHTYQCNVHQVNSSQVTKTETLTRQTPSPLFMMLPI